MNKDSLRTVTGATVRATGAPPSRAAARRASTLRVRLREATTEAILTATEAALAEHGLAGATMQAIAARAGVSVGTVYNHFRDRDELFRALFAARRHELAQNLTATLRRHARDPFRLQLTAFVRAVFAHFDAHRAFARVALESELARHGCVQDSPLQQIRAHTLKIVRAGVREGALRAAWTDIYPGVLGGILRGTLVAQLERDRPLADASEAVIDLFLHGALIRS